jgi:hypothetical protein
VVGVGGVVVEEEVVLSNAVVFVDVDVVVHVVVGWMVVWLVIVTVITEM